MSSGYLIFVISGPGKKDLLNTFILTTRKLPTPLVLDTGCKYKVY